MELIFEVILQLFGELLLQGLFEVLLELGLHSMSDTLKKPKHPVLSTIGFILWGAIAGAISLWIVPHSPIRNPDLRTTNLFITPLAIAGLMALIGKARDRKGQVLVKLDRFGYAFAFAFAMALVRYIWVA